MFVSNLRQLNIEVKPKYFELELLIKKVNKRGSRGTSHGSPRGAPPIPTRPGPSSRLLRGTKMYEARVNAANRLTGAAARAKAWAKLEADLMRNDPPVAVYADFTPLALVSRRNFGCWSGADANLDLAAVCKK